MLGGFLELCTPDVCCLMKSDSHIESYDFSRVLSLCYNWPCIEFLCVILNHISVCALIVLLGRV